MLYFTSRFLMYPPYRKTWSNWKGLWSARAMKQGRYRLKRQRPCWYSDSFAFLRGEGDLHHCHSERSGESFPPGCHPERKRRIFSQAFTEKRFFVAMLLRMTGGRGLTSLSFRAERGILFFVYLDSSVISFPQNDRVGAIRFFTSFRMTDGRHLCHPSSRHLWLN